MKYNNIKGVLRNNIKSNVNNLWTWDKEGKHFTCIYKEYTDDLTIYTPQQLIDEIDKEIKEQNS
tara:strand:- start:499 stop:690 length:192 start_codon:yes stop_codon:yes gene_type:complete